MEPGSYSQYTNDNFRKKLILLIALAILMSVALILFQTLRTTSIKIGDKTYVTKASQALGTMKLTPSGVADGDGLVVKLNGSALTLKSFVSSGSFSKNLPAGDFTLEATKPGFKPLSVGFTITPSRTTIIGISLLPVADTTIHSWSQVQAAGDPAQWDTLSQLVPDQSPIITISSVAYFYNKTWALITTYDGSQYAYELARYDAQKNTWIGTAGTTKSFTDSDVYSTPKAVQSYLENNNFTYIGQQ